MCNNHQDCMQEERRQKALEHDMSDVQNLHLEEVGRAVEEGMVSTYQKMEDSVVGGYKKIEDAVVSGYKKMEDGIVDGFAKVSDKFVEKLFTRKGETVEEAKKRLNGEKMKADR